MLLVPSIAGLAGAAWATLEISNAVGIAAQAPAAPPAAAAPGSGTAQAPPPADGDATAPADVDGEDPR